MKLPPLLLGPRGRAWLAALDVLLLVCVYLVLELTYARSHLPPNRYEPLPAGTSVRAQGGEFRLLSLRQTEGWGRAPDGGPEPAEPGAVWVLAELEVTPYAQQDFLVGDFTLVATDGSTWDPESLTPRHEGEGYPPDDYEVGRRYTYVKGYQVPIADAGRLAGLARSRYDGRAWPLIRPAA